MKIALSGKMKSGKSTLARQLNQTYNNSTILSFADPIRNALKELGITKDQHSDLYRAGAQYIGTDLCRAYDPNWWVKQMKRRVVSYSGIYPHLFIDDMRFENEYDYCDRAGFLLV